MNQLQCLTDQNNLPLSYVVTFYSDSEFVERELKKTGNNIWSQEFQDEVIVFQIINSNCELVRTKSNEIIFNSNIDSSLLSDSAMFTPLSDGDKIALLLPCSECNIEFNCS